LQSLQKNNLNYKLQSKEQPVRFFTASISECLKISPFAITGILTALTILGKQSNNAGSLGLCGIFLA